MSRLPFLLVLVSSAVLVLPGHGASGAPKGADKVPMRSVPCAMDDLKLAASGLDAVVCWDKGCMKLDMSGNNASWIVKPPKAPSWTGPVAVVKDDSVCVGATCKPFGKKLTAAVAEHKKNLDPQNPPDMFATTDLKAVTIGSEAWSVKNDKPIKLTAPPSYRKTGEKPNVGSFDVAGDLLVVYWSACAGPCTKFSITDSSGTSKGREGEGGGDMLQLDAKRFVLLSEYSEISVFEIGSVKPRGNLELHGEPDFSSAVRLDDETIAVLYSKPGGKQVVKVDVPTDKRPLRVAESMFLPSCAAP